MADQSKEESQQNVEATSVGFQETVQDRFRKIKEHAETYPYVWGSYIFVYGTVSLWLAYRWRRLRKTEDRVRVLQQRLVKLVEAEKNGPPSDGRGSKK